MKHLPATLLPRAIDAVRMASGQSWARVEAAYERWQRGLPADPCRYGKEKPVAIECRCNGCFQSLAFLYFDQVAAKFSAPLTPFTTGFDA